MPLLLRLALLKASRNAGGDVLAGNDEDHRRAWAVACMSAASSKLGAPGIYRNADMDARAGAAVGERAGDCAPSAASALPAIPPAAATSPAMPAHPTAPGSPVSRTAGNGGSGDRGDGGAKNGGKPGTREMVREDVAKISCLSASRTISLSTRSAQDCSRRRCSSNPHASPCCISTEPPMGVLYYNTSITAR